MRVTIPFLLALALLLVGCDDVRNPAVVEEEGRTPEPIEDPIDDRCEAAPEELVALVAGGLTVSADLEHAMAVESEDLEGTTFVSAELVGADIDTADAIGTWAVTGEEVVAINAVARELSEWPDGTAEHGWTMDDDGGEESMECVEAESG